MGFKSFGARAWWAAIGIAILGAVAACGGGASHDQFHPQRLIVFGDDISVIDDSNSLHNGRKYSVNAVKSDNVTVDCVNKPIWTQYIANAYGLVFSECNPDVLNITPRAFIRAKAGAKAADLQTQIDAQLATDALAETDMVTVLVGMNDVLEQYANYPAQSSAEINATLADRGSAVAAQVNRIAALGAKVLVVTVPDMGYTPLAVNEKAAHTDIDRAQLLKEFTASFNTALRLGLINDGRKIGLVLGDEMVQAISNNFLAYGFVNVTAPVCLTTAPLPNCTTQTLIDNTTTTDASAIYLWADTTHLSPGGHTRLGSEALTRAQNNPF